MNCVKSRFICIVSLFLVLVLNISSCTPFENSYYIFSDISECQGFEIDIENDEQIIKYDIPERDAKIANLEYENFYGVRRISSDVEFEIFAYEFKDLDSAKKYFENVTGKRSNTNTNFSASTGGVSYRLVVIDSCNAYTVYTSLKGSKKVQKILQNTFTVELDFSK